MWVSCQPHAPIALTSSKQVPLHPLVGKDFCILFCRNQTFPGALSVLFTNGTGAFLRSKSDQDTQIHADVSRAEVWNVFALKTLPFGFIYFSEVVAYKWGS